MTLPVFDIHSLFGPDLTPPGGLDWERIQAFARFALEAFVGQIAIAFGGIDILGWKPFDFLADWGQQRIAEAQANYLAATNAQTSANFANAQLVGLTVTDVVGGVSLYAPFTGTAAFDLGGDFVQTYAGPGGGALGIDGSGNAVWYTSGGNWRQCTARHVTPLATDYQQVRMVATSTPFPPNFGASPANYLCARVDSTASSLVYCWFSASAATIGYSVGGVGTDIASTGFVMNPGDTLDFFAGTDNDDREFIIKRNGDVVLSTIDSGASSAMGSSNRYVGLSDFAADANVFTAQRPPGQITAWGAIDRQPATH